MKLIYHWKKLFGSNCVLEYDYGTNSSLQVVTEFKNTTLLRRYIRIIPEYFWKLDILGLGLRIVNDKVQM